MSVRLAAWAYERDDHPLLADGAPDGLAARLAAGDRHERNCRASATCASTTINPRSRTASRTVGLSRSASGRTWSGQPAFSRETSWSQSAYALARWAIRKPRSRRAAVARATESARSAVPWAKGSLASCRAGSRRRGGALRAAETQSRCATAAVCEVRHGAQRLCPRIGRPRDYVVVATAAASVRAARCCRWLSVTSCLTSITRSTAACPPVRTSPRSRDVDARARAAESARRRREPS